MGEQETPMHPELAKALRSYELEMLDGTERSQNAAYERLKAVRRNLGDAAIIATPPEEPGTVSDQLAAS